MPREVDYDEEDDDPVEQRRRRRRRRTGLLDTLRVLRAVAWGLMLLGTLLGCALYLFVGTRNEPGAGFDRTFGIIALSSAVIVMYVLARGVEKLTGVIAEFVEPTAPRPRR